MKPKFILSFAAILLIPLVIATFQLFTTMTPELQDMLPLDSKYLKEAAAASKRIWPPSNLVIWIENDSAELTKKFQEAVVLAIEEKKIEIIGGVEYKIGPEAKFFYDRIGLFLSPEELKKTELELSKEKGPSLPFFGEIKAMIAAHKWQTRFSGSLSRYTRFKDGTFASPNGKIRLVILRVNDPTGTVRLKGALEVQEQVKQVVDETVGKNSEFRKLKIRYTGNVRHVIEDHESIYRDIEVTSLLVLLMVGISLLLYFRSIRDLLYLGASLLLGVLICFGCASLLLRPMNANAAFMTSIIIGNGINFGIILLTRIREIGNVTQALKDVRAPTLLAMAGGIAAYGSLGLTDFRGFQQFGIMGVLGMTACWASAMLIIPALVKIFEGDAPTVWKRKESKPFSPEFNRRLKLAGRVTLLVLVACVAIAFIMPQFKIQYETDLTKLRDAKSAKEGSLGLSPLVDKILGQQLTPYAILTSSRDHSKKIAQALLTQTNQFNPLTIDQLVPEDQPERIRALHSFKKNISKIPEKKHSGFERNLVETLIHSTNAIPFTEKDVPESVLKLFDEKNGDRGKIVYVEVKNTQAEMNLDSIRNLVDTIQKIIRPIDPAAILVSTATLVIELVEAIQAEAKRITLWVFLAIFVLVFSLYRQIRSSFWILSSWLFALLVFASIILLTHTKLHMINFLAIPITVGIGIDYAANLFTRLKTETLPHAVSAVALCSLTTCLGYLALFSAGNLGLRNFGLVAFIGEVVCLTLSVLWAIVFSPKARSQV